MDTYHLVQKIKSVVCRIMFWRYYTFSGVFLGGFFGILSSFLNPMLLFFIVLAILYVTYLMFIDNEYRALSFHLGFIPSTAVALYLVYIGFLGSENTMASVLALVVLGAGALLFLSWVAMLETQITCWDNQRVRVLTWRNPPGMEHLVF